MYITVTPNPALNRVSRIIGNDKDRGVWVKFEQFVVGGSGIVAGRVLKGLGEQVILTGFLGGENCDIIERMLSEENLDTKFIRIGSSTRNTYVYYDPNAPFEVEYKELGPILKPDEIENQISLLIESSIGARKVLICGSVPRQTPLDFCLRLVEAAHENNCDTVVDGVGGDQLLNALSANPSLAKCNQTQAEEISNRRIESFKQAREAAISMLSKGAISSMISLGPMGAVLAISEPNLVLAATPPKINPVDSSGCGDTLLAAYIQSLDRGHSFHEALAIGTAFAVANALQSGVGHLSHQTAHSFIPEVKVLEMAPP